MNMRSLFSLIFFWQTSGTNENSTGALLRWLSTHRVKPSNQKSKRNTTRRSLSRKMEKWKVLMKVENSEGSTQTFIRAPREPVSVSPTQYRTLPTTQQTRWCRNYWIQNLCLLHRNCSLTSTTTTPTEWTVNPQLWVQFILPDSFLTENPFPSSTSHSHWIGMLSLTWI